MNGKKHEFLLVIAALIVVCAAMCYSVLDSPKYNTLEAIETKPSSTKASTSLVYTGKININTADKETLSLLEHIGEIKAQAIINYREENGVFRIVEEITNVDGISTIILEDNYDRMTV